MRHLSPTAIVRIVCIVIIVGILLAWGNGAINPVVNVPTPVMPKPNAYNDFAAAAAAYKETDIVDNAFVDPAVAKRDGFSLPSKAEIAAEAERDMPAMQLLRAGFVHAYQAPLDRRVSDRLSYNDNYAKVRGLARTLAFEGRFESNRADWNEAATCDVDAVVLGNEITHGSDAMGDLVGMACSAIGRQFCWPAIPHLDSTSAEANAMRVEDALASRSSLRQVVQQAEWSDQSVLADAMRRSDSYAMYTPWTPAQLAQAKQSPEFYSRYQRGIDIWGPPGPVNFVKGHLLELIYPKRAIYADFTKFLDQEVRLAGLPYILRVHATRPTITGDPVSRHMTSDAVYLKCAFKDASDRAFTTLLMTSFALRAYRLDHGSYPASLSGLVPEYLKAVPIDPFSNNQPLQYRLTGSSYLLYSIGPDGVDDGGKPFVNNEMPSRPITTFCEPDTKGDIVAFANPG